MPIYEYRCQRDHRFELLQKFSDDPVTECEVCGAPAQRVLHPVAIHFKGSGFYSTDYGRKKKGAGASADGKGGEAPADGKGSSDAKPAKSDSSGSSGAKAAEG